MRVKGPRHGKPRPCRSRPPTRGVGTGRMFYPLLARPQSNWADIRSAPCASQSNPQDTRFRSPPIPGKSKLLVMLALALFVYLGETQSAPKSRAGNGKTGNVTQNPDCECYRDLLPTEAANDASQKWCSRDCQVLVCGRS
jgi:hypothetical protein